MASSPSSPIPSPDELVARATAMVPALLDRAPEAEQLRRTPDATVADVKAAGFARTHRPGNGPRRCLRRMVCRELDEPGPHPLALQQASPGRHLRRRP